MIEPIVETPASEIEGEPVLESEVEKKENEVDTSGVVEELKKLRKSNAELVKQLAEKPASPAPNDIEATVQSVLQKERDKAAVTNRETAISKFRDQYKEFHPDNDPSGIKFEALSRELNNFNTTGLTTVEDFLNVLDKARRLIVKPAEGEEERIVPDASSKESVSPKSSIKTKLTDKENKVIKQLGWTEEKFLDLKAKQPAYVAKIIAQAP